MRKYIGERMKEVKGVKLTRFFFNITSCHQQSDFHLFHPFHLFTFFTSFT
jgi:hypothetical protein